MRLDEETHGRVRISVTRVDHFDAKSATGKQQKTVPIEKLSPRSAQQMNKLTEPLLQAIKAREDGNSVDSLGHLLGGIKLINQNTATSQKNFSRNDDTEYSSAADVILN